MEMFALMWEEREGSWLCGIFSTPELAKAHLEKELISYGKRQQQDIEMWKKEAGATSGNDAKHALRMAQFSQDELDAGLIDLQKNDIALYNTFGPHTVTAYKYCGETFSISKYEIDVGNRMFNGMVDI